MIVSQKDARQPVLGIYVPTQRNGKPNIYCLRRLLGNGPDILEYQKSRNGYPPYYYGAIATNEMLCAYSFSAIKNATASIVDPDAESNLQAWEERVGAEEAERIRNESIQAGRMAHTMLERWNRGQSLGLFDMNMAGYVQALKNSILPHLRHLKPPISVNDERGNPVPLSEVFVANFDQQFIGRLDLVAEIATPPYAGTRVILELKGSRNQKQLDFMRGNIIQAVAYMKTFNEIAAVYPQVQPLDGLAIAYIYRCGTGQFFPIFGDDITEYLAEWERWQAIFHDRLNEPPAA